jgi:hypothetical protein
MCRSRDEVTDSSFVVHLWMEPGEFWRGRVSDGDDERVFEDGITLLDFIRHRVATRFAVPLPIRRKRQ